MELLSCTRFTFLNQTFTRNDFGSIFISLPFIYTYIRVHLSKFKHHSFYLFYSILNISLILYQIYTQGLHSPLLKEIPSSKFRLIPTSLNKYGYFFISASLSHVSSSIWELFRNTLTNGTLLFLNTFSPESWSVWFSRLNLPWLQ